MLCWVCVWETCARIINSNGSGTSNISSSGGGTHSTKRRKSRTAFGKVTINWFSNCCHQIALTHKQILIYAHAIGHFIVCCLDVVVVVVAFGLTHSFILDSAHIFSSIIFCFRQQFHFPAMFYLASLSSVPPLAVSNIVSNKFMCEYYCIALHVVNIRRRGDDDKCVISSKSWYFWYAMIIIIMIIWERAENY